MRKHPRYRWAKISLSILLLGPDLTIGTKRIRKNNDPAARRFRLRNLSASGLELYWVNMATEERRLQFELVAGASDTLNSHIYHEFEIREQPSKKGGKCKGKKGKCRKRHFQISVEEDQVFTVDDDFKVIISNSRTIAEKRASESLRNCRNLDAFIEEESAKSPEKQIDLLAECMAENVQESLYKLQEEIDFQASVRRKMGARLKDYACQDPRFPTTQPIDVREWNPNNPRLRMDDLDHTVNVLLRSDTTLIATIENVATPWDCQFVEEGAGIDYGQRGPPHIPWEARKNPAFLDFLTRIYAYVDPAVKLIDMYARLPQKGEVLFELHQDSAAPPHQSTRNYISDWPVEGNNFARLIMFCDVPEQGGAINFPESGVHVNPKVGEGLLITYTKQSATEGFLESFTNEHIDCPILEGKRTIVQHQFRMFPQEALQPQ